MFRCVALIAASFVLHTRSLAIISLGNSLPLSSLQTATFIWCLKWCLTCWAVYESNVVLNRWAENKWFWKHDASNWNWDKEIAVVTGGSQGIGACVVKRLVSYGVSCAVLDVAPLSASFTAG
jgi:all-trans-retinol dehydrogenase (NAD+)